jgi:hypothetical protein
LNVCIARSALLARLLFGNALVLDSASSEVHL